MNRLFALTIITFAVLLCGCKKTLPIAIVPEPVKIEQKSGSFRVDENTILCFGDFSKECPELPKLIRESYERYFNMRPNLGDAESAGKNSILFILNEKKSKELGDEGYIITVKPKRIVVEANTGAGCFYGLQTLLQMAGQDKIAGSPAFRVPCAVITDHPRFGYRGAHLDVSRHFFDTAFVKKYIDILAFYKLNKFHWHLTDDHGWRVQIDKYPLLTSVGAWRPERTSWDTLHPVLPGEAMTYGGFYTKGQIRDIVKYAAARNIDIIPEIEIPGHCSAILAAYPQFACDDYPYTVAVGPYWPPKAIMCAGNDDIITFYNNVLDEIAELFPYKYIHIGGDEAFNDNWQVCPKCQKRIEDEHLADEFELQQWLMNQIEKHLKSIHKKAIIWDDIVSEDMVNTSTIMCWQGTKAARTAAKHGNDVIMCPTTHCYFNYYQCKDADEPLCMEGYVPLGKAYSFEPMPEGLGASEQKHILGAQCNIWTEFINTPEQAEYMLMPRLFALSECVWSKKENKNAKKFESKVEFERSLVRKMGYNPSKRTIMDFE